MKRFDLRHLKNDFCPRLKAILDNELEKGEVGIFCLKYWTLIMCKRVQI